jgi:hypothetical protein
VIPPLILRVVLKRLKAATKLGRLEREERFDGGVDAVVFVEERDFVLLRPVPPEEEDEGVGGGMGAGDGRGRSRVDGRGRGAIKKRSA